MWRGRRFAPPKPEPRRRDKDSLISEIEELTTRRTRRNASTAFLKFGDAPARGASMTSHRKRFCTHCATRIRRSAKRCHYCGRLALRWTHIASVALLLITVLTLLGRLVI
jgi:hypothetical protein